MNNGAADANQAYGALNESLHIARFSLERAFRTHLEPLIMGDAWRECGAGFDDINAFMDSLRLDKFKMIANERKPIVNRIKELQPEVSNRQISRTLGVDESTVRADIAGNPAGPEKNASGNNGEEWPGAGNPAPPPNRTSFTGETEWYTPVEHLERARRVLGVIDLDPASSAIAQERVKAAQYYTRESNGLARRWRGRVWLNPPYAQPAIEDFIDKLIKETATACTVEAILLTHNYTDTAWFHKAAQAAALICFTRGRIAFEAPTGERAQPTQGQAFFYFGPNRSAFVSEFADVGFIVEAGDAGFMVQVGGAP
jgi:phage N-6-adenine-methyltransferase